MKLLFLSQVLPYPLDAGPKVRSYYVLRYLAQHHAITLVTFVRRDDPPAALAHLKTICQAVHPILLTRSRAQDGVHFLSALVQNKSFLILRDDLAAMHTRIARLLRDESFAAVHADQLSMAHYAVNLPLRRVLDEHNAVWTITQRMSENETNPVKRALLANEADKVKRHEARLMTQFDQIITVTEQDAHALHFSDAAPRAPIQTIPICIDPAATHPITLDPCSRDIIFLGSMLYPPNVDGVLWFANEILPRIRAKAPETRFYIVGARPAASIVALGQSDPRIIVTGYVADATPYLEQSAVFLVPLRAGGGMRVKILDAWARGLPIVTTSLGCEGIEVVPNENLLVADSPASFASAVLQLLNDPPRAQALARSGRAWVESHYAWRSIYTAFDRIYPPSVPPPANA